MMVATHLVLSPSYAFAAPALPPTAHTAPQAAAAPASTLADADNLLTANKYKDAEEAFRELITDDETGDAYAGLAVSLAKQASTWAGKIYEAEKILKQAKSKFPDNPNVMAAGGYVAYVHSKNVASPAKRDLYLEAAENLSKEAIKSNQNILIAQQTLGLTKLAQDDVEAAVPPFRQASQIAENAVNLTLLAQALLRIDPKDTEGEELALKALKLNSNYHPARLQKAISLTAKGKLEDAFIELKNIPQAMRGNDWFLTEGNIYRKQGDGPAALASWRESIRLEPHNPSPYRQMAEYYALRGDGELAIAQLHDALEILPNDMPLRTELAELALRQDKLDVAETEYRTILAAKPDDASAILGLSRVYFRKARRDGQYPPGWQQLMDQLQNVVTETSVKGQILKGSAKNLQESVQLSEAEKALASNRYKEAREMFCSVINNHKEDAYELLTLGEQAFNDGDLQSAEKAYTYAKDIPEVTARAEQGISKIQSQRNEAARHTKLGNATHSLPDVALDHYKQALIADPQYPDAYYGLFTLYGNPKNKKGDPEKAINYANSYLESTDEQTPQRQEVESALAKIKQKLDKKKKKK